MDRYIDGCINGYKIDRQKKGGQVDTCINRQIYDYIIFLGEW